MQVDWFCAVLFHNIILHHMQGQILLLYAPRSTHCTVCAPEMLFTACVCCFIYFYLCDSAVTLSAPNQLFCLLWLLSEETNTVSFLLGIFLLYSHLGRYKWICHQGSSNSSAHMDLLLLFLPVSWDLSIYSILNSFNRSCRENQKKTDSNSSQVKESRTGIIGWCKKT